MFSRDTTLIRNIVLGLLIAAAIHGAAWWSLREATQPPDLPDLPTSLSFSPYINQRPEDPGTPPVEQIDNDLRIIAPFTRGVRTYATRGTLAEIPRLAGQHGLDVWIGLWLGREIEVPPPAGDETPEQQAARKFAEEEYQRARFNEGSRQIIKFIIRWRKALELSSPMVEIVGAVGIAVGMVYAWMMEVRPETFVTLNLGLMSIYPHAKLLSRMQVQLQKFCIRHHFEMQS